MPDGHRAGGVEPHQPVGLGATTGGIGQGLHVAPRTQGCKAFPNRLVGQRRDPQALDGDVAVGELIDVAKDQLALAASVAGVDDLGEALVAQQIAHRMQLVARGRDSAQLKFGRHHGQRIHAPGLPAPVVAGGLVQLNQVADAPGDDPVLAFETRLSRRTHVEHTRQVARYGRLFCDHQLHHASVSDAHAKMLRTNAITFSFARWRSEALF